MVTYLRHRMALEGGEGVKFEGRGGEGRGVEGKGAGR